MTPLAHPSMRNANHQQGQLWCSLASQPSWYSEDRGCSAWRVVLYKAMFGGRSIKARCDSAHQLVTLLHDDNPYATNYGDVAQLAESSLSIREAPASMPAISYGDTWPSSQQWEVTAGR